MTEYLLIYHGGSMPETQEEGEKMMALWQAWFTNMGNAVVNPGNPVGMSQTVSAEGVADNGGANPVSGFSIVKADSPEAAAELAKGCPVLINGSGTVEIAPVIEM